MRIINAIAINLTFGNGNDHFVSVLKAIAKIEPGKYLIICKTNVLRQQV